jgi:hypothetical protein
MQPGWQTPTFQRNLLPPHSADSFVTLVYSYQTTQCHISEDFNFSRTYVQNTENKYNLLHNAQCYSNRTNIYNENEIHRFYQGFLKKKKDKYEETIDAGASIKWIKTVTFAYMYLLNQKKRTPMILFPLSSPICITSFKTVINPHMFSSTFPFQTE